MEIERDKHRQIVKSLLENFKNVESELMAYRMVFLGLKMFDPSQTPYLDQAFQQALESPALRNKMNQKYDEALEKFLKQVDESLSSQELMRWLEDWKPEGSIN